MSGGGGGGGGGGRTGGGGFVPPRPSGGGGQRPGSADPCEILITLPLSAVQLANIRKIERQQILDVRLRISKGATTVVVIAPDGSVVGAVAYRDVQTLIDCIEEGNTYRAKVIELGTTSVKVQISRP